MNANAVLYMRMSTDKQDNSIESQRQVLKNFAKNNKYIILKEYVDKGVSGREAKKRPSFLRMIEDSEKNLFTIILIYDTSRFARNLEEFIVYKSTLKRSGIDLISVTEPKVDEDTSLITDAMLGALNEMYSRKLSKSVKRGMLHKAQQGIYQTPPPFGYYKKNGEINIIEEEAIIVRQIFDIFLQYKSFYSVAVKLNELGIKTRSNKLWSSTDIKRMLKNRGYIGEVFYSGNYYKGKHIPIISIETFIKVEKIVNLNTKIQCRPSNTYKHWLSGLIKCSYCNGNMSYSTDKKGNSSYRCGNHKVGKCKYSNFLSVNKLETLIKQSLTDILAEKDLKNYEYFVVQNNKINEITLLKKALNKIDVKLDRCRMAYIDGIDTIEEYRQNKKTLNLDKFKTESKITNLSTSDNAEIKLSKFRDKIKELYQLITSKDFTIEQKNIAMKSIINKIVLNKYNKDFIVYYYL